MDSTNENKMYNYTLDTLNTVAKLPIVRVNREEFLRNQFSSSPYIEQIIQNGPQSVYTVETLRNKAKKVIKSSTNKTSLTSFASGLPSNIAVMLAAGGADVAQYFGFAINMAQKIAYLFGEDDLFNENNTNNLSDEATVKIIGYLGAMFGVSGATSIIAKTSTIAGKNIGKKVAAQALTKTTWYPIVKKVGAIIGQKITKKTVEKTITKAVPVIGGIVSGGITYITFKPLGNRLANVLANNLEGVYDEDLELNPDFINELNSHIDKSEVEVIDGDFVDLDSVE
ncbi:hypothetical protein ACMDCO_00470 [Aerococcus urinaeequi]|uniref:hypothetical protein n=1 Tax=Aerococcus urinaeequi TaxID=51665 RepID=UPI0039BC8AC8